MVTSQRWEAAQRYERSYWAETAHRIATGSQSQLDWYRWRAEQLASRLRRLGHDEVAAGQARVIEVGCGPIGVCGFFPASLRVAVDPLEEYYRTDTVLSSLRSADVRYVKGVGEDLPAESGSFDLVVIENCIDHVQNMPGVMSELRRVCRPDGLLYLTVNVRTPFGYVMHRLLSRARIDAGHPHTFTPPRARRLVESYGFDVLDMEVGSYAQALREDLRGPGAHQRIKAVLGISEYVTSIVARRRASP